MTPGRARRGLLYPALRRLEHKGLLQARTPAGLADTSAHAPRVYEPTQRGRAAHGEWVRVPVDPATISRDLGLHLLRFVMMEPLLPRDDVLGFLQSLRDALAASISELERYMAATEFKNHHSPLALEHGVAIHRASLRWATQAIAELSTAPLPPAGPPPWLPDQAVNS